MKKIRNRKTVYFYNHFEYNGEWLKVIQGDKGLYIQILDAVIEQLDIAISIHKRVLVYRFDLHVNYYEDDNKRLTKLINRLKLWLLRNYDIKNIGHIWVREKEASKKQHYHCALYLDGNKIQHPKKLTPEIKKMWMAHGHMPVIKNSYYYIEHNNRLTKRLDAIERLSYLAKVRGKGYRNPQAKDYGASRMKIKLISNKTQPLQLGTTVFEN